MRIAHKCRAPMQALQAWGELATWLIATSGHAHAWHGFPDMPLPFAVLHWQYAVTTNRYITTFQGSNRPRHTW